MGSNKLSWAIVGEIVTHSIYAKPDCPLLQAYSFNPEEDLLKKLLGLNLDAD
ncbi:MAG: hypothetical protein KME11_07690 [Timaviella obliquedivisa GSE-PSE-MK23-08B]|nr:hypothetical protein [Timaviella obliquedivisa GSE-PSE-MK23-08B]